MRLRRRPSGPPPPAPGTTFRVTGTSGRVLDDPTPDDLSDWLNDVVEGTEEFLILNRLTPGARYTFCQTAPTPAEPTTFLVEYHDAQDNTQFIVEHQRFADVCRILNDWMLDRADWSTALPWEPEVL